MKQLLTRLQRDYPLIHFQASDKFQWTAQTQTIHYDSAHKNAAAFLLHEVAHAELGHADFQFDIELVKKESQAWHHAARMLAPRFEQTISEDVKQDAIDSYRDWLHARSLCPQCLANSFQTKTGTYSCLICGCQWRANQARLCELRRYRLFSV